MLLFLTACGSTGINLGPYYYYGPTKEEFKVCHGYSCSYKAPVQLSEKEWKKIIRPFRYKAKTSEQERKRIAQYIANMEKVAGHKSGTDEDLAAARGRRESLFQMDCIDETINTSLYLKFLKRENVLKYHDFNLPVHRGYLIDGRWPHNSATIREIKTDQVFVIDSFYRDNGQKPYIMPVQKWIDGWKP